MGSPDIFPSVYTRAELLIKIIGSINTKCSQFNQLNNRQAVLTIQKETGGAGKRKEKEYIEKVQHNVWHSRPGTFGGQCSIHLSVFWLILFS